MSNRDCQLTKTCFATRTDELANEGSTTPKITDTEDTSSSPITFTTSQTALALAMQTAVSLDTTDEPSTEGITSSSRTSHHSDTTLNTKSPTSTAKQHTKITIKKYEEAMETSQYWEECSSTSEKTPEGRH